MLSGEGSAEQQCETTIGLITKKQLCTCKTLFCTFFCGCFARLQRETSKNVLRVLVPFCFHCRSFLPCIGDR